MRDFRESLSLFSGFLNPGKLRRQSGWVMPTPLISASAVDWDGTQLVGSGATFAKSGGTVVLSGGVLDLQDAALSATVDLDLSTCTIVMVSRAGVSDNSRDASLSLSGVLGVMSLEAKIAGVMAGRVRCVAGYGYTSTLLNLTDNRNNVPDLTDDLVTLVVRPGAGYTKFGYGEPNYFRSTATDISRPITTLTIGRDAQTNYLLMEFAELLVFDDISDSDLARVLDSVRSTHSASTPYAATPIFAENVRGFGDSIWSGASSSSPDTEFATQMLRRAGAKLLQSGWAGTRLCTLGESDPTRLARSFPQITGVSSEYTGVAGVVASYGVNDFDNDSPIGSLGDSTEDTVHGGLRLGIQNFLANAPSGVVMHIMTPCHRVGETVPNGAGATLEDVRVAIRQAVANDTSGRVKLIEVGSSVVSDQNLTDNGGDGLHPDDAGHAAITEAAFPQLIANYTGV